jgi:hypothetical protein
LIIQAQLEAKCCTVSSSSSKSSAYFLGVSTITIMASEAFHLALEDLSITFDFKPDNLQLFLDQARDRSIVFDWLNSLGIPSQGDVGLSKDPLH